MIGKPEWFTYKIFGWGAMPRTWQGLAYVLVSMLITVLIIMLPVSNTVKIWLLGIFIGSIFLDILHIMVHLPEYHDERQNYHQLVIERNVSFAATSAVIGAILYQTYRNRALFAADQIPFDISLAVVLGIMLLAKILSFIYVRKRL